MTVKLTLKEEIITNVPVATGLHQYITITVHKANSKRAIEEIL